MNISSQATIKRHNYDSIQVEVGGKVCAQMFTSIMKECDESRTDRKLLYSEVICTKQNDCPLKFAQLHMSSNCLFVQFCYECFDISVLCEIQMYNTFHFPKQWKIKFTNHHVSSLIKAHEMECQNKVYRLFHQPWGFDLQQILNISKNNKL